MGVTALEHVLVLSDDIDVTRDFYRDVVGLEPGARPSLAFPGYWLYAEGAGAACLHIAQRGAYLEHAASIGLDDHAADGAGQRAGTGAATVDHIAFDADDYDSATGRIEQHGLSPVRNNVPGGPRQLFVTDPNGVLVEINVKRSAPVGA
jgi:catechol 2,3-dioxygenase-like lactoylglutathione lyase family enzyme